MQNISCFLLFKDKDLLLLSVLYYCKLIKFGVLEHFKNVTLGSRGFVHNVFFSNILWIKR